MHILSWWRHQMETFSALLTICAGNSPVTGEFPSQRQVARSSDVFFIYAWINGGVNSHEAGDLRRHRAHYDVIAMVVLCGSYLMIQFTHIRQGCFTAWLQDRHWDNHFKSNSKVTSAWWFYAYLRGPFTCIWTIYRQPQCWKSNTEGRTAWIERLR